jgi:hypothetical protein
MHDILYHTKQTITIVCIENDAVECYDHMVNNLLFLKIHHHGVPKPAEQALADTWSNAIHHIHTRFSVSTTTYGSTKEVELFGPGQGSTLVPFLWPLLFSSHQ